MNIDISGIAYAIRTSTAASTLPIKLSQAQQCTAAALGYNSLAAWQASRDATQALHQGSHLVLDTATLLRRAAGLHMPHKSQDLIAILDDAFSKKLPGIGIHDSLDDFEEALRNLVQDAVLNDGNTTGPMAVTNNDGIREIYLPFDIEWNDLPVAGDGAGDGLAITIEGHVAIEVDLERPYSGHRIDVGARLWLARQARSIFNVTCHVEHAQLDWGNADEERDDRLPKVSLAEALADELGLEIDEADQLVEAHVQEIEGHEDVVYGYIFDFSDTGADGSVLAKIKQRYGSLNVRVSPNFFDNVDGRDANPDRHYVHGDQVEGSQDHYYCAHCDMFVASDHFEGEHPGASEGRYFSSLNAWQRTPAENKINTRRPASAINILAATALASREAKEAARSDFHRWLELQVDRNDPVGDLAKDVAHDVGFPSSAKSKKIIRSYLAGAQASGSALEAFEAAWKEFALSGK